MNRDGEQDATKYVNVIYNDEHTPRFRTLERLKIARSASIYESKKVCPCSIHEGIHEEQIYSAIHF